MLHKCFYLPAPNPPPLLSITAPLHLPCITRRRYILSFLFSSLLSNSNKKVMAVVTSVRGNDIIQPVVQLMAEVIKKEDTHHILQFDLRPLEIVVQDIAALQDTAPLQAPPEVVKIWLQLLRNSLAEAKRLLDRSGRRQRCLDWLVNNPRRQSQQIRGWNAFFNDLHHVMQTELSMSITSLHFLSSKPLLRKERVAASVFVDGQPLSRDEAWMLFRRVAFKDVRVSMDIEERARIIADECKGRPLAINVVAASMIGQSSVQEWDNCLSSVKKVDPSFAPTHPHLDAELYRLLRWSYDSLPNSIVKNCFLYCAFYKQGQEIDSRELVEMLIGEGHIKSTSKQRAYSMDMAIGCRYVKLLVHRSLFHIVKQSRTNVFRPWTRSTYRHDVFPSIGVNDAIREMAMYITQKEENCFFMTGPIPPNLPEADYAKCRRISFPDNYSGALPTDLRCPNLTTLILQDNTYLELLPTELLLSRLTSLRVLNLSGCTEITSVPTSMGQLRLLEFLTLSELPIRYLGEEVCHLSQLQILDLSGCQRLESLPSQIGQLKKLKHLNLDVCYSLKMIPPEISELTSLSRLQLYRPFLSMEREAPASIWSLTGLQNLTELKVVLNDPLKDGIMGTWSEMRHLVLAYSKHQNITHNLPDDMQNMKKLQSLFLIRHGMLSLPNCKFEHLDTVKLYECGNIRELSALEWLPNLKYLKLRACKGLSELGIGSRVPSGYLRLQKLVLGRLEKLESVGGPSNTGVWDQRTLPNLRVLKIDECFSLRRLPIGMEKLRNLCELKARPRWWEKIVWEDDNMKVQLQKIFVPL